MANKNSAVNPNKSIALTLKSTHQLPFTFQKQVLVAVGRDGAERIERRGVVVG